MSLTDSNKTLGATFINPLIFQIIPVNKICATKKRKYENLQVSRNGFQNYDKLKVQRSVRILDQL